MSSCTFTTGSVYCEDGCCTDACCSVNNDDKDELIAILVCAIIGPLVLLLLAFLLYITVKKIHQWYLRWAAARRARKLQRLRDLEAARNQKDQQNALTFSTQTGRYGGDDDEDNNKMTQTLNHRSHHTDVLIAPKRRWVEVELTSEQYEEYLRALRQYKVAEVGCSTSGKDLQHKHRRKWNSTANYYTRRDSLKGSSEDDDTLEADKIARGVAREKVNVGAEKKLRSKNARNWQKITAAGWVPPVKRKQQETAAASRAGGVSSVALTALPGDTPSQGQPSSRGTGAGESDDRFELTVTSPVADSARGEGTSPTKSPDVKNGGVKSPQMKSPDVKTGGVQAVSSPVQSLKDTGTDAGVGPGPSQTDGDKSTDL